MVDIYRSRKGYNYRCLYWKRDKEGAMDNEELVHKEMPSGIFYARVYSDRSRDKQDVAGVFRTGLDSITLETNDTVDIEEDDLVQFNCEVWIAGRSSSEPIQKMSEFGYHASQRTILELRKGR